VIEQPRIKEIDINPLLATSDSLTALDARVVLHGREVPASQLPRPVIRPYPSQYVMPWKLKDGTAVTLRPIRPEDEPLMVKFHQALSEESVRMRYFQMLKLGQRVAHERLTRVCFNDYDRELAIVAEHFDEKSREHEILGIGRLSKTPWRAEAEVAVLVHDAWQKRGLGSQFVKMLLQIAKDEKLERVTALVLPENQLMCRIFEKLGFKLKRRLDEALIEAEFVL
jgi:acetyltransferase